MTEPNMMRPGLPKYKGPKTGLFWALHHKDPMVEYSHNVMERVRYVKKEKASNEVAIRLHHMLYLGGCRAKGLAALAKAGAAYNKAWAAYKKAEADFDKAWVAFNKAGAAFAKAYAAVDHAKVLAYARKHIPDCAWTEGEGLDFNRKMRT